VSTPPGDLDALRARERALRAEVGQLVGARRRAEVDSRRLDARHAAGLGELADVAAGHREVASRLQARIDAARAELRALERRIEELRLAAAEDDA
jgi:hypothetical protein